MKVIINEDLVNRKDVNLEIEDRGYQFGDGVYEVIRIYESVPYTLDEHIERFYRSAYEISISPQLKKEELKKKLIRLIQENQVINGGIYVQITRGIAPRKHHYDKSISPQLLAYTLPLNQLKKEQKEGVATLTGEDLRWLRCDIKSLNLLYNVMMKQKAYENGAFESILIRDGYVTEGTSSNVFMIKDQVIYTHPANHLILDGITRRELLNLFKQKGWNYEESAFLKEELMSADEVFITSTTTEVIPVVSIDGLHISNGVPGSVTKEILKAFTQRI